MAGEAKYHLVYVTTHPRGIIEFMEISEGISPDPTVLTVPIDSWDTSHRGDHG
jgi:hypothetical protein